MNAELESLLQAFDQLAEAAGRDIAQCRLLYSSRLKAVSDQTGVAVPTLHALVHKKYLPWVNANKHTTSMPPKA